MGRIVHNLKIENALTGKITPVAEIGAAVTAERLISAYRAEIGMPSSHAGKVTRLRTNTEIRSNQTLDEAGVQDGETLQVDLDYVPG